MNKRSVGSNYEEMAVRYLRLQGLKILANNFRCRMGEVDIIAQDKTHLIFVEVKYRRDSLNGNPADAVNYRKQQKICKVADFYRIGHRLPADTPIRFDVVAILGDEITWHKNAFYYCGSL